LPNAEVLPVAQAHTETDGPAAAAVVATHSLFSAVVGTGRARRHPSYPADTATVFDGAARSPRFGTRGRADRCRGRTRLPLRAAAHRHRDGGGGVANGARTAHRRRHLASAGPASRLRLSV
jgi:hypothetical protein